MAISKKTVLITGCSEGGIGYSLATAFAAKDHHVFATVRDPSKAGSLSQNPDIEILTLDVTIPEEISFLATKIAERTGGTLDVLINNAGADFVMPLLDVDLSAAKKLYDTNVWSILAMTQAFVPLLVKAGGSICNITSIAATLPLPYAGIYASSKAAATHLSETSKLELAPLGVRVITGMIGSVDTPIQTRSGKLVLPEDSYYKPAREQINGMKTGASIPTGQSPDALANSVVSDILGGKSGRIWRGTMATTAWLLTSLLPHWLLDFFGTNGKGLNLVGKNIKKD